MFIYLFSHVYSGSPMSSPPRAKTRLQRSLLRSARATRRGWSSRRGRRSREARQEHRRRRKGRASTRAVGRRQIRRFVSGRLEFRINLCLFRQAPLAPRSTEPPNLITWFPGWKTSFRLALERMIKGNGMMFQGGESQRSYSISHNSKAAEARRKRGGSMDNLIDSVEANPSLSSITSDTKKKCSSIKNLSCMLGKEEKKEQKEVKITSVWLNTATFGHRLHVTTRLSTYI